MHHPPHSPDLPPTDYHLFPNLKKHLCGLRFSTNDELKYATEQSNCSISKAMKNSKIAVNCTVTKAVIVLKK